MTQHEGLGINLLLVLQQVTTLLYAAKSYVLFILNGSTCIRQLHDKLCVTTYFLMNITQAAIREIYLKFQCWLLHQQQSLFFNT